MNSFKSHDTVGDRGDIFSETLHQNWLWRQLQTSVWKVNFSIGPWKPKLGSFKAEGPTITRLARRAL